MVQLQAELVIGADLAAGQVTLLFRINHLPLHIAVIDQQALALLAVDQGHRQRSERRQPAKPWPSALPQRLVGHAIVPLIADYESM